MSQRRNGCFNRPPFRTVMPAQDGWYLDGTTRTPRLVAIAHRMAQECQYTHTDLGQADAGCAGCKHRVENKNPLGA